MKSYKVKGAYASFFIRTLIWLSLLNVYGCHHFLSADQLQLSPQTKSAKIEHIHSIKFTLPSAYTWRAEKGKGENITVFSLHEVARSPIKVMYQRLPRRILPSLLATQVTTPLRSQCQQSALSVFKTNSRYSQQVNYEVLCPQIKDTEFGMISYLTVYSDETQHHLLIAEIITPSSRHIGQFSPPKNEADQKAQQKILDYIQALQTMMVEAKVCDANKRCIKEDQYCDIVR